MNMRFLTTFVLLWLIFSACSKFEHEQLDVQIPSCELCDWADSLEGEYDGHYNYKVNNWMIQVDTIDSLHFSVQHIFLDKGPFDDSTRMFFQVTRTGGSNTLDDVSIWVADDSLEIFRNTGFDEARMNKDSIVLIDLDIQSAFGGGSTAVERDGVFYRQ
jgi:hypothetical protein